MNNRCGIAAICGRPNTGKSTLLNGILGHKVAIVSNVPQTTRNIIRGILTAKCGQIVFMDTPGIHKPRHQLGKYINIMAMDAVSGADVILHIVDSFEAPGEEEDMIVDFLKKSKAPVILVLNKIDLGGRFSDLYIKLWEEKKGRTLSELADSLIPLGQNSTPPTAEWMNGGWGRRPTSGEQKCPTGNASGAPVIVPVSGLKKINIDKLTEIIFSKLPEIENLYPQEMVSDFPQKLLFADIIREKLLYRLRQEVPHSVAVLVEEISGRSEKLFYVKAIIFVERPSQKAIIIGAKGRLLKEAGIDSRKDIEALLNKKVYLELRVSVRRDWKSDPQTLKMLGYVPM